MNPKPVCPQNPGVTGNPGNTELFARAARPVRSDCAARLVRSDRAARLAQSVRRPNVPAPLIFMLEGTIQYVGAGLAVGLFALFAPLTVAWLRSVIAGVILVAWRRPWGKRALTRQGYAWSCAFGVALVAMNTTFYEAIARLPLGTTVSIEFLGPVIFAAIGLSGIIGKLAVLIAFSGVVLIGGIALDLTQTTQLYGLIWALVAGGMWVAYMALGRKVALLGRGMDSLAVAVLLGSFLQLPFAIPEMPLMIGHPEALVLAVAMSTCSSVIPYVLEQVVMRGVRAPLFALLSALLPVTSLAVGLVMLRQVPSLAELGGLALVSVALALTYRRS
ncbi:EamA family transporter [Mobiluncus mulieris]|uniref:EamA family transporter n=2 Tax=Mobiluncus mulieris TaxID=2052 RepID=UPI000E047821|nr:EamA family transporter [Mobiluncus mulieris]STY83458.1 Inner membrane transporter rhtA [Mobiluncus mulieris]